VLGARAAGPSEFAHHKADARVEDAQHVLSMAQAAGYFGDVRELSFLATVDRRAAEFLGETFGEVLVWCYKSGDEFKPIVWRL
jgi:hypothetical protein